jgi:hypothetical protein
MAKASVALSPLTVIWTASNWDAELGVRNFLGSRAGEKEQG